MNSKFLKSMSILISVAFTASCLTVTSVNAKTDGNSTALSGNPELSDHQKRVENEYIVKYKDNVKDSEKEKDKKETDSKLLEESDNGVELLQTDEENVDKAIEKLEKDKNVEYVCPNYIREATYIPDDELIEEQWAIKNTNAEAAWDIINDAENLSEVKVAVIDTGMDMDHEDLQERISDDGYDFVDMDADPTYGEYDEEHATHVAGIIAATSDNGKGVSGMTGKVPVKIMPIRVLEAGYGDDYTIAEGIKYATDEGADIINLSLGGFGESELLDEAVNYAMESGVIVVAAAGNSAMNTKLFSPASIPGVVTVSGTDSDNNYSYFTNYGSEVDIAAPAEEILSTIPEDEYEEYNGTSMAAPAICAAAAMVKSMNPDYTEAQIEDILYNSAKDLSDEGRDKYYGYGLVDYEKALQMKPSDSIVKIQDIDNNKRVFYSMSVNVKSMDTENLKKLEFYLDNELVSTVNENLDKILIGTEIDLEEFEDGISTLKVVATDKNGETYEDSVNVNIVNNVTSDVRVQVVDNGEPVSNSDVYILCEYTYENEDGTEDSYMETCYFDVTDENGFVDVEEDYIYDMDNYVVYNEIYEYLDEDGDDESDCTIINENIKEMSGPGLVEMDNNDLVTLEYKNNIEGINYSYVDGQYKLDSGKYLKGLTLSLSYGSDDEYIVNVPEGIYKASLEADSIVDGVEKIYMLKDEFNINKGDEVVSFNLDNTAEVNEVFEDIESIDNETVEFGFSEDGDLIATGTGNAVDEITFVITPQKLSPIALINIEDGGYTKGAIFEGEEVDYKSGETYVHEFGKDYESEVELDKKVYEKGSEMLINPIVKDSYENLMTEIFYWDYYDYGEESQRLSIRKLNKTSQGYKFSVWNNSLKKFEGEVKPESLLDYKITDYKGNVVEEESMYYMYGGLTTELPEDIESGDYKLELTTKVPYDLTSKIEFEVE